MQSQDTEALEDTGRWGVAGWVTDRLCRASSFPFVVRLNRPLTLSEKILYSHLDDPEHQVCHSPVPAVVVFTVFLTCFVV